MTSIWLDTDVGTNVDDAFALALAARDARIALTGVSTVSGNTAVRAAVARRILDLAGTGAPVVGGHGAPITIGRVAPMAGHHGVVILAAPPPGAGPPRLPEPDPDDWTVATGPLTNLAWMARTGLRAVRLSVTGGLADETNWTADPAAAEVVLDEHTVPLVHPVEVTRTCRLSGKDLADLGRGDDLAATLARLARIWLAHSGREAVVLHDPVAVAAVVEDGLCEYETVRLELDDDGSATRVAGEPNCRLAVSVDARRLRDLVLGHLLG